MDWSLEDVEPKTELFSGGGTALVDQWEDNSDNPASRLMGTRGIRGRTVLTVISPDGTCYEIGTVDSAALGAIGRIVEESRGKCDDRDYDDDWEPGPFPAIHPSDPGASALAVTPDLLHLAMKDWYRDQEREPSSFKRDEVTAELAADYFFRRLQTYSCPDRWSAKWPTEDGFYWCFWYEADDVRLVYSKAGEVRVHFVNDPVKPSMDPQFWGPLPTPERVWEAQLAAVPPPQSEAHKYAQFLNHLLALDRSAVNRLVNSRVVCGKEVSEHPFVQTVDSEHGPAVGLLGILNGLLGDRDRLIIVAKYKGGGIDSFEAVDPDTKLITALTEPGRSQKA